MYLKMYIKSERFYQQPDNQALKEERCFSDYEEELDDRKCFTKYFLESLIQTYLYLLYSICLLLKDIVLLTFKYQNTTKFHKDVKYARSKLFCLRLKHILI